MCVTFVHAEPKTSTMPAKITGPQREAQRARIWHAHTHGSGYGAIAVAEGVPKSTVQSIIAAIRKSGYIQATRTGGRKSKLNA